MRGLTLCLLATALGFIAPAAVPAQQLTKCALAFPDSAAVTVSATDAHPASLVIQRIANLPQSEGFEVASAQGDSSSLQIITRPRLSWPKGTESETWHGNENPGVVLVVTVKSAGRDSATVAFSAIAICQVPEVAGGAPSTKPGQMLEMITALSAANAFSKAMK